MWFEALNLYATLEKCEKAKEISYETGTLCAVTMHVCYTLFTLDMGRYEISTV